jgi:DNA-binding MarR family transcriptional regulator
MNRSAIYMKAVLHQNGQVNEAVPDQVLPLLQLVSDLVTKRSDRFLVDWCLTTPQYELLLAAATDPEITLGDLSDQLHCSRGNVTGIVDRLERDGWLVRERSLEDRRVIRVRLTEKGYQVRAIQEAWLKELAGLALIWPADQRASLTAMLQQLYTELTA